MCHFVTWFYSLCLHQDADASSSVPCQKALRAGYECLESHQSNFSFPLPGRCLECKYEHHQRRIDLMRKLNPRSQLNALGATLDFNAEDWNSGSDGETESDVDLEMPLSPTFSRHIAAESVEKTETGLKLRDGLARKADLIIPSTPIGYYSAVIEAVQTEGEDDTEEPWVERGLQWRSWIPLPTRLPRIQSRQKSVNAHKDVISEVEPLIKSISKKRSAWQSFIPLPKKNIQQWG